MDDHDLGNKDFGEEISALERLAKLKEAGILDPAEFKEEKDKILHHALHPEPHVSSQSEKKLKTSKIFNSKKKNTLVVASLTGLLILIVGLLFYTKTAKSHNLREIAEATEKGD